MSSNPFARAVAQKSEPEAVSSVVESKTPAPTALEAKFAGSAKPTDPVPVKANPLAKMLKAQAPAAPAKKIVEVSEDMSLDDLNDLDLDMSEEIEQQARDAAERKKSQFPDETPATAPTRDLPEELDKGQKLFIQSIDSVYQLIDDPDLLSSVIKNIMIELKENPQYMQMVVQLDVRTWIRAMRQNMGIAKMKKQESATKLATGGKKKTSVKDEEMNAIFDDLGLGDML